MAEFVQLRMSDRGGTRPVCRQFRLARLQAASLQASKGRCGRALEQLGEALKLISTAITHLGVQSVMLCF